MTKNSRKPAQAAKVAMPAKSAKPAKPVGKLYILFGADEYARPRAAKYVTLDPDPLKKAAQALSLRLIEANTDDLIEIARRLPSGRLHGNGQALVPFVKDDIHFELVWATVDDPLPAGKPPSAEMLPATWDDVAPGHLVIAQETHICGWLEAIVVERNGDLLTLRFRDYPDYGPHVRHRSVVALLVPAGR